MGKSPATCLSAQQRWTTIRSGRPQHDRLQNPGSDCASGAFHGTERRVDAEGAGEEDLIFLPRLPPRYTEVVNWSEISHLLSDGFADLMASSETDPVSLLRGTVSDFRD